MLASDDANPQFQGARNPDDILHVTFYVRPIQDNFKTEKEGKAVFFDQTWVKIMTPGNSLNIIDTPALKSHEMRFPRQWAQFKNSQAPVPISGTPVEEWPVITRAQAEELKAAKFFTVEQIANCSDYQAQQLGMNSHSLRERAKAFLSKASGSAEAQAAAAENARLKAQLEAQSSEIASLRKMVEGVVSAPRQKRPYTRRKPVEATPG